MSRQTFTLGRFLDIRVGAHVSWLAVYALVTVVLARDLGMLSTLEAYAFSAVCALALFASVVAHELAHALVARRFGVRTSAITLFLFGGIATLDEEPRTPRAEAWIAIAGPAMSALLALAFFAVAVAIDRFAPDVAGGSVGRLATYVALANGVLAVFNAIPAYPMDGGRVLRALVWGRTGNRSGATVLAARLGIAFAALFVVAAVALIATTHDLVYAWYALLGIFLGRQGWMQERMETRSAARTHAGVGAAA